MRSRCACLATLFPDLGVRAREHLGVEEAVALARHGLCVGLSPDFYALARWEMDVLVDEARVERVQIQRWQRDPVWGYHS